MSMTAFHRMAHQLYLAISAICPASHALTPLSNSESRYTTAFTSRQRYFAVTAVPRMRFQTIDFTKFEGGCSHKQKMDREPD